MRTGIRTQEAPQGRRDADEDGEPGVAPTAIVLKLGEDLLGRRVLARDPEDDHEDEEADHVDDHEDAFGQRELARAEDVEGGGCDQEEHDEERGLPEGVDARVGVSQQD